MVKVSEPNIQPEELQNTCKSFRHSLQKYEEHITTPNLVQPVPDIHLDEFKNKGSQPT